MSAYHRDEFVRLWSLQQHQQHQHQSFPPVDRWEASSQDEQNRWIEHLRDQVVRKRTVDRDADSLSKLTDVGMCLAQALLSGKVHEMKDPSKVGLLRLQAAALNEAQSGQEQDQQVPLLGAFRNGRRFCMLSPHKVLHPCWVSYGPVDLSKAPLDQEELLLPLLEGMFPQCKACKAGGAIESSLVVDQQRAAWQDERVCEMIQDESRAIRKVAEAAYDQQHNNNIPRGNATLSPLLELFGTLVQSACAAGIFAPQTLDEQGGSV